ncbi:hypothetical protein DCCM_4744 [Desulfocucumis palustris]|uniref:Uncharacterized protein n=1 Tax=Desulfocucumis palustris TaxID=1898651 RepID=A0A2L2XHC9_9FIRM|nr:stalk domain-containing protein [Desulfocucumis palustris]GBF35615.1 hypothetical protein DCCM_4744 [Desulfocucumis palustris]
MFRLLRIFLLAALLLALAAPAFAGPRVVLDGNLLQFDTEPTIENGTTLVPLRKIFESMGATVSWNEAEQKITAARDAVTVTLTLGQKDAFVNGEKVTLNAAPKTVNGRTLVPLRFIGEAFGASVVWDAPQNTVIIKSPVEPEPVLEELPPDQVTEVHIIDSGYANAVYLKLADGSNILIDAGYDEDLRESRKIINYLEKNGVDELDLLVVSSPTSDYMGNVDDVLSKITAKKIIDTGQVMPTKDYEKYKYMASTRSTTWETADGQRLRFGNAALDILSYKRYVSITDNATVICRLTVGNIRFLFTGNAALKDLEGLSDMSKGNYADVLLVPAHGDDGTLSSELLAKIAPKTAVISVGNNVHRDPGDKTLELLSDAKVKVYRTDVDGDIVITTDGKNYSVGTKNQLEENKQQITAPSKFIGDIETNVYHTPGCPLIQNIPDERKITFKYSWDAKEAGFEPCKLCNP